jgi:hypothetical protein
MRIAHGLEGEALAFIGSFHRAPNQTTAPARPQAVQPANRLAAAAPKNTTPESAVIQKLTGQSV